jgi:mono/diheme cytochrome c family protein
MNQSLAATITSVAAGAVMAGLALSAQTAAPGPGAPAGPGRGDAPGSDFLKRPPVARQEPAAEQQMFQLQPGYRAELLMADPLIQDPVHVTFDGNGRMYVLEMRSYMRDVDGSESRAPISRISRHEDTDGDGKYDRHTVFADNLVLPRIAFPLGDGAILALDTDNRDLYKWTDTDGDGVADKKEVFYPNFGRVTNMEWQPGAITWALDNWLYASYNPYRLRIAADGKVLREETEPNTGQWGSAQDNYGKVWFVEGGREIGPINFQVPIAYAALTIPDGMESDFQVPWPTPGGIADMQGGMNRVRLPDGTLNHFTAAAGPEIYRGHRLPSDLVGNLFFNEPVGRIVRRAKVDVVDGLTHLSNAYPHSEFIRSTDPLFRPVSITNAPDGTLYLTDMYTGIIQDAQFAGPGSYLRRKIEQYALDHQHNWGRIWRITYEGLAPDRTPPRMYGETAAQLVTHLEHPSGWWRDTAQKLLVLRQDKSVVPLLTTMARTSTNQLARIHALWTLEGLSSLDAVLARALMKDSDPKVRVQAIRASETLYKAGDKSFVSDYRTMIKDPDPEVVIQAMLTLNLHAIPQASDLIRTTAQASTVRGITEIGTLLTSPRAGMAESIADPTVSYLTLPLEERRSFVRGQAVFRELCSTCHGDDGKGTPMQGAAAGMTLAPPLAGQPRVIGHRDYIIKVLLKGLSGDIDGKTYQGGAVMVPMGQNTDEWIADVASFVRMSFGNQAAMVTPSQVAQVRMATARRTSPWTLAELVPSLPTLLTNQSDWKFSASVNTDAAANAISGIAGGRWDTGVPQAAGQWFQMELPAEAVISEVQLESAVPGAARGRGAGPAAGRAGGAAGAPAVGGAGPAAGRSGGGAPGAPAAAAVPGGRATAPAGRGAPLATVSGPIAYTVQVSTDGTSWSAPVAQGQGGSSTIIAFRPVRAKFVRITQTGVARGSELWGIQQIRLYQAPPQ